jgi:hypothetical protein
MPLRLVHGARYFLRVLQIDIAAGCDRHRLALVYSLRDESGELGKPAHKLESELVEGNGDGLFAFEHPLNIPPPTGFVRQVERSLPMARNIAGVSKERRLALHVVTEVFPFTGTGDVQHFVIGLRDRFAVEPHQRNLDGVPLAAV